MDRIRILLVDDHSVVRAGLRMLLESQPDMEVVGEAEDGRAAIEKTNELRPDIVVMDIAMPEISGLEATERIKAEHPDVKILTLTMHEDERYFFRALHAGASGYMAKGAPPEDFVSAVRAIAQGQAYIYPALTKKLLDEYLTRSSEKAAAEPDDGLTKREREVLRLIADGYTSREIGEMLGISPHTVERHRQNTMAKLGLHSRAELIKYAIRKGLIELDEE
ncbi:MAG: response regulator transcription factor [Planctomycetes bacterium]|nr:response regulator transcription factor [Planctomycetota bacterium]